MKRTDDHRIARGTSTRDGHESDRDRVVAIDRVHDRQRPGSASRLPDLCSEDDHCSEPERTRLTAISCEGCGRDFLPIRSWQRCCSDKCRATASRRRDTDRLRNFLERFERLLDRVEHLLSDDPGRPE